MKATPSLYRTLRHVKHVARFRNAPLPKVRRACKPIPAIYKRHLGTELDPAELAARSEQSLDARMEIIDLIRPPLTQSIVAREAQIRRGIFLAPWGVLKRTRDYVDWRIIEPEAGDLLLTGAQTPARSRLKYGVGLFVASNATGIWTCAGIEALAVHFESPVLGALGPGLYVFSWGLYGLSFVVGGSAFASYVKQVRASRRSDT